MTERAAGRMLWVDAAKALGIYLVLYSHLNQSGFAESFLWTFHVPLFFFVSGYLSRAQRPREFLGNATRKLLLPYVLIYTVTAVATAVLHADYDPAAFLRTMLGIGYGTHSYPYFVNDALWFLPSLLTVEALYMLGLRRWPAAYLPLLALSYVLYRRHALDLYMSVDLSLLGLNFFLAGVLARRADLFGWLAAGRGRAALGALAGGAATAAAASVGNVWYAGEHYALSLGAGLAGILMVACVSLLAAPLLVRHARARALVTFLSSNTLFVFCFHVFSNPAAEALVGPLGLRPALLGTALTAALSIALLVPFNLLARRFAPELIGLRRAARAA